MRYDVHVAAHSGGEATRFELERGDDEQLQEGDFIRSLSMSYRVVSIRPLDPSESDEFDAIVHAEWAVGPAESRYSQ
jgi:hypothetical protein